MMNTEIQFYLRFMNKATQDFVCKRLWKIVHVLIEKPGSQYLR